MIQFTLEEKIKLLEKWGFTVKSHLQKIGYSDNTPEQFICIWAKVMIYEIYKDKEPYKKPRLNDRIMDKNFMIEVSWINSVFKEQLKEQLINLL